MNMKYQIPDQAQKDLIDIIILIEADVEATTGFPQSQCKMLVAQMLITLVETLTTQSDNLKKLEDEKPKTVN
jgi:hypothetical protein